jgi:hypothetical protein
VLPVFFLFLALYFCVYCVFSFIFPSPYEFIYFLSVFRSFCYLFFIFVIYLLLCPYLAPFKGSKNKAIPVTGLGCL